MTIDGLKQGRSGSISINKKIPTTGTPVNGANATGSLGMATKPTVDDDTVTIGTKVYTFVTTPAVEGDVAVGALVANSQANLVAAIGGDAFNVAHPDVRAGDFAAEAMPITARKHGIAANSIDLDETFTDGTDAWTEATLLGGVAGTGGDAGDMLIDATYLYISMSNHSEASPSSWRRIALGSAF